MGYFKRLFSFLKFIFTSSLCTRGIYNVKFFEVRIRILRISAAGKWLSQLPIKKTRICKRIICIFICICDIHDTYRTTTESNQKYELQLSTASSTKIQTQNIVISHKYTKIQTKIHASDCLGIHLFFLPLQFDLYYHH